MSISNLGFLLYFKFQIIFSIISIGVAAASGIVALQATSALEANQNEVQVLRNRISELEGAANSNQNGDNTLLNRIVALEQSSTGASTSFSGLQTTVQGLQATVTGLPATYASKSDLQATCNKVRLSNNGKQKTFLQSRLLLCILVYKSN